MTTTPMNINAKPLALTHRTNARLTNLHLRHAHRTPRPAATPQTGILAGNRLDNRCKGERVIYLFFQDVFLDPATATTIFSMPPDGIQYPGQHWHHEISVTAPAKEKNSWGLIFKVNPGLTACEHLAENLGVTAFDDIGGDGVTDRWQISTDTIDGPAKTACLAREDKGNTTFEGYVDMQFGFEIRRLW